MPVTPAFREFVLEQLVEVDAVTARAMFGGYGLYSRGFLFAVLDDDTMYLRTDEPGRAVFVAAGSRPFAPIPGAKPMLGYWEIPADVLEDRTLLAEWCERARGVAETAKAGAKKRARRPATRPAGKRR